MSTQSQKLKMGFPPIYNKQSKLLILGSFPSVKSREINFYYGNKQNRFWKMLCSFFGEEIPISVQEKWEFLLNNRVALWDIVAACDIQGSADSSIKNVEIADLNEIFQTAKIEKILLNGTTAYQLFMKKYADISIPYEKMPSTSPANPRYNQDIWWNSLKLLYNQKK